MQRIVVGVDGSPASRKALAWAVDEAATRDAAVEVVHAWQTPFVGGYPYVVASFEPEEFEEGARALVDEMVDDLDTSRLPHPLAKVVVCDTAARALLDMAKGADLLVVGSRGRGGFTGLLLGSVSQQVVTHAPCPVVVVPDET